MPDNSPQNSPDIAIINAQIEAANERRSDKTIKLWQFVLGVLAIMTTIFGTVTASYNNINANIVALQKQDAVFDLQISELRKKTDYYDQLIQRRDQQWTETTTRMTRMETMLQLLTTKRMTNDQ